MITINKQMLRETEAAILKDQLKQYRKTRGKAKKNQAGADLPVLTEDEKRRKALEIQAQLAQSYTCRSGSADPHVTGAGAVANPQREGVRGGRKPPLQAQKIAGSSAATRAPEAAARTAEKTKPNRRENEFMLNLMILRNTLRTNAPSCRDRARLAGKWIWRDIRLMLTLVDRIQNAMLETMPASRDEYYLQYAKHGHYELRIDGPVKTARHLLVTDKHLGAICEAAMKSECILCMREGGEINRCELREALLEAAPPTDLDESDGLFRKCEYRDAAGALVQGNDVTI